VEDNIPLTKKKWFSGNTYPPHFSPNERNLLDSCPRDRKTKTWEEKDIIQWGTQGSGNFIIKGTYDWAANHSSIVSDII
jgi:hypothetical protein